MKRKIRKGEETGYATSLARFQLAVLLRLDLPSALSRASSDLERPSGGSFVVLGNRREKAR